MGHPEKARWMNMNWLMERKKFYQSMCCSRSHQVMLGPFYYINLITYTNKCWAGAWTTGNRKIMWGIKHTGSCTGSSVTRLSMCIVWRRASKVCQHFLPKTFARSSAENLPTQNIPEKRGQSALCGPRWLLFIFAQHHNLTCFTCASDALQPDDL